MSEGGSSDRAGARIALALAGGGPEGAIYEIGALRALDEALAGVDLNNLFVYVGVSAGAFLAACLANNLTTAQMCRAIVSTELGEHPFVPETFLTPALGSLVKSGIAVPRLLAEGLWDYATHAKDRTLLGSLLRLSRALPLGVFDNAPILAYLQKIYTRKGRTDDFRELGKRLVVVATDLDTGKPVRFGDAGLDHVPISRAVQASAALPGLYAPVEIDGRHYVDGVLHKTLHASVALEAGAELVLCINPLVPVDTQRGAAAGLAGGAKLLDRGLPTVLSQTFRTLIHSRLEVGMAAYRTRYGHADTVLLEPERDDYLMFFTNIFGFKERRAVCEHAYASTRRYLAAHADRLEPIFARHGVTLRREELAEPRDLWASVGLPHKSAAAAKISGHPTAKRLDDVLSRLEKLVATIEVAGAAETEEPSAPQAAAGS
ncbi:MAG TPA: patatin-like phospholipase family protein [Thermoanaerobaculia bacterium]